MKRRDVRKYQFGSPNYILAHAKFQASRGRQPSAPLTILWATAPHHEIRNPRRALDFLFTDPSRLPIKKPRWKLCFLDTQDDTMGPLPGIFHSYTAALRYADEWSDGLDHDEVVFIIHPDGTKHRHSTQTQIGVAA